MKSKAKVSDKMESYQEACDHCENRHENPICALDHLLPGIQRIKVELHLKAGDFLFKMGDAPRGVYAVRAGVIKLESYSRSGAAHTPRVYGPGAAFGYRSMMAGTSNTVSAVAVEDCSVCLLPKETLLPLISKDPEVLMNLVKQLSQDLEVSEKKWSHQMDLGSEERIAEALVFLFDRYAKTPWTRKDIGQWAGTTPETVIRTLAKFEKAGFIDQSSGRIIKILNRDQLVALFDA